MKVGLSARVHTQPPVGEGKLMLGQPQVSSFGTAPSAWFSDHAIPSDSEDLPVDMFVN